MLRHRHLSLLIFVFLLLGMMVPCLAMAEEAGKAKEGAASDKGYMGTGMFSSIYLDGLQV